MARLQVQAPPEKVEEEERHDRHTPKGSRRSDIVSKDEFGDFELELEWKIGEGGQRGIFYRGTEEYEHIYWSAPEYQLLDDIEARRRQEPPDAAPRAAYGLYAAAGRTS